MTTLVPEDGHMVLINTFSVDPDRAEDLLRLLSEATKEVMARRPGFVSANLHLSDDRRHVTNYAQWRSKGAYDAVLSDPQAREHMEQAASLAKGFDPIIYELREVHDRPT